VCESCSVTLREHYRPEVPSQVACSGYSDFPPNEFSSKQHNLVGKQKENLDIERRIILQQILKECTYCEYVILNLFLHLYKIYMLYYLNIINNN
jgi:hypothetical protein